MGKEGKRQKIHDAVIRRLYPPPPPPRQEEENPESVNTSIHNSNFNYIGDDVSEGLTSSEGEEGNGPDKLTRAQRKRLRTKKLKQAASQQRRKMIGPQLPTSTTASEEGVDAIENEHQGVRQDAAEGNDSLVTRPEELKEETSPRFKRNKLKQRRMAKKMATEIGKLCSSEKG